jgi:two-component system, NtrC family, sensor kinase
MMNAFPMPFRITAAVLVTVLVVVIGLLNLRDRALWVDATDGIYWVETEKGLQANEVIPGGAGEKAGVLPGDILQSINRQEIQNRGQHSNLIYGLGVDATAAYRLIRGSETQDVIVKLGSKALLTRKDALRTLLAFLYLAIGLFVIIRGGDKPRAFHFFWVCLVAFVVFLYSWTPNLKSLDWVVYVLSFSGFLLLPATFVHFCMRFPAEKAKGRARALLTYMPAAGLMLMQALFLTGHLAAWGLPRTARSSEILDRVQLAYFALLFFVAGAVLLKQRRDAIEVISRQQMKWVGYGTFAAIVPFTLIYVIPTLFGVRSTLAMDASMLFLVLMPLAFAYAVVHYRLLDVEVIARRSSAYFIASATLLVLYILFILVAGKGLQSIAPNADFFAAYLAALVVALLFAPFRGWIQRRLDRFFYRDQFSDRASLLEFAQTLSTEISLSRLSRRILERVSKTFQVDKAALFLSDAANPGCFRLIDTLVPRADTMPILFRTEDLLDSTGGKDPFSPEGSDQLHRAGPACGQEGLHFMHDLNLRGRRIGMIAFGQLPMGRHFSTEDTDLLGALSSYAAIALENANLYHSIETKALALERLKIYTENIIESINVAVIALDLDGKIGSCNRAFEELYGVKRNQILGAPIENLLGEDVISAIHNASGKNDWDLSSGSSIFKQYLKNRRNEDLIVNLSVIPLMDSADNNSGSLIVLDDITEKIRMEDQLLQAERLSSVGLLAAGVAHEVNTPLTGISSYTQMLLKEMPETDHRKPILEKIEKQTFRAAEIVNGLLNFARINGSEYQDIDLNKLIGESISLLDHQMRQNHIKLSIDLDPSIPAVYANSGKLQQVFINLFLNARDAMPSGGELKVVSSMNDSMVTVDIEDTGVGISSDDIKRIYDPFFTTKKTGKGTGLGLAVSYGIIQEHGGRIFVDSAPGKGAHFKLKLPTRKAKAQ